MLDAPNSNNPAFETRNIDVVTIIPLEYRPIMSGNTSSKKYLIMSFAWVTVAYLFAVAGAFLVVSSTGRFHPVIYTFIADIAATLVVYIFGRIFRNASFYDPFWSLAPMVIAFYWMLKLNDSGGISWTQILVISVVILWGLRLTFNWASQWQGLKHEDWRYTDYRRRSGKLFWLIELVGIDLVPTIVVFGGCLCLYPVLTADQPAFGILQAVGLVVTLGAIIIETVADVQLKRFLDNAPSSGAIMNQGLWKYSRHPNYLGEILFWWGLWLFVPGHDAVRWLTLIGPLAVTALFVFVSIPLMEKRNLARRSGYALHAQKVPVLVPWFFRK